MARASCSSAPAPTGASACGSAPSSRSRSGRSAGPRARWRPTHAVLVARRPVDWLLFRRRGAAHQSCRRYRGDRVSRAWRWRRRFVERCRRHRGRQYRRRHRPLPGLRRRAGICHERRRIRTPSATDGLHLFPIFLRDGQRLLYFRVSRSDPSGNGLYVADLRLPPGQQSQTRIIETGFSAKYSSRGSRRSTSCSCAIAMFGRSRSTATA